MKQAFTIYDPSTRTFTKNGQTYKLNLGIHEDLLCIPLPWPCSSWSPAREVADTLLSLKEGEWDLQESYNNLMAVITLYAHATRK